MSYDCKVTHPLFIVNVSDKDNMMTRTQESYLQFLIQQNYQKVDLFDHIILA